MINQIAPVQQKTGTLPVINRDLLKARHIQARLKTTSLSPYSRYKSSYDWTSLTPGPYLVPVSRWTE